MSVTSRFKQRGHFIEDRKKEIVIGLLLFIVAGLLMYDAFEKRGRPVPWPVSKFVPW